MINSYLSLMENTDHVIPDDPAVVQPIFKELQKAFRTGATRSANFRKQALRNLLRGYTELKKQFQEAISKDLGGNHFLFEVMHYGVTETDLKETIDCLDEWMKPHSVKTPLLMGKSASSYEHVPLGVVLVLSAWNYPIFTALPQVAVAIAAGNCVILKPSEIASYSSKVLKKLFDNYLDQKCYRCIEGKVEVAKAVSRMPFDLICFTGSTFTGRLVGIEAAKNLTPCLLELGGKCPTIVDETANLQSAVNRILTGRFLNCGQTCVAVDHLYVHESIYQPFKDIMIRKLKQGYSNEQFQSGDFGRIISTARFDQLAKLLNDKHEGKILFGGLVEKDKMYFAPTVVENPRKDSLMMQEEIFGPILPVFTYQNINEVINEINDRDKPLAIYVFSESKQKTKKIKDETQSGCFSVNECMIQVGNCHLPFGGVGKSGYGRYHGDEGFRAFSNQRSIVSNKSGDMYPSSCRFPPYTQKSKGTLLKLAKYGSITYSQIGKVLLIILILVILGLGLGFGIPAIIDAQNK